MFPAMSPSASPIRVPHHSMEPPCASNKHPSAVPQWKLLQLDRFPVFLNVHKMSALKRYLPLGAVIVIVCLLSNMELIRPTVKHGEPHESRIGEIHLQNPFPKPIDICDRNELEKLRATVRGSIACPGEIMYKEATFIFNTRYRDKIMPAIVVQPEGQQGVVDALSIAKANNLQVTVKNGGHNPAGLALHEGGMLIDMSKMKGLTIDEAKMQATAESGVLWIDVQEKIKDRNWAVVGGGCPTVGVIGLALGGGIGWLSRSKGLVSDNFISFQVVLPNGTVVTASDNENADLFWGLRGAGGSNFGVVLSGTFKLFAAEEQYFAGEPCFTVETSEQLRKLVAAFVQGVQEIEDDAPSFWMVISRGKGKPTGNKRVPPVKFCVPLFFDGPAENGPNVCQPVLSKIAAVVEEHPDMACPPNQSKKCKLLGHGEKMEIASRWIREGGAYQKNHTFVSWSQSMGADQIYIDWRSGMVYDIQPGFVDAVVDAMYDEIPMQSDINSGQGFFQFQVEHLRGAMSRLPDSHGSFHHRNATLLWSVQTASRVDPQASESEWARQSFNRLDPYFKGSYANYADASLESKDWADRYYGRDNYKRLQQLKEDVGGFDLFTTRMRIAKDEL